MAVATVGPCRILSHSFDTPGLEAPSVTAGPPHSVAALLYHDVIDGDPDQSGFSGAGAAVYKLDQTLFRAHLQALRARIPAAPARVQELRPAPDVPLLITFDDGGRSAFEPTLRLLGELGWPAHFFVTADRIGSAAFLGTSEIRALAAAGHVIGSHSWSHPPRLSALPRARILEEWQRSIRSLEDILGERVTTASVPGGFHSRVVAEAAAEAGVAFLFTSEPTVRVRTLDGMHILGRFSLRREARPAEAVALATGAGFVRARHWLRWNGVKPLKALAGPIYIATRERLLRRAPRS